MKQTVFSRSDWTLTHTRSGPVTRDAVRARARELAVDAGRASHDVAQDDYEQAKREVTGESDLGRQEEILEATDTWS
jgi:hypothetical protein